MKNIIAISSCFLIPCRYDGKANQSEEINCFIEFLKEKNVFLLPICPEQLGGLGTPRIPAEQVGDKVINQKGEDVTKAFKKGARNALSLLEMQGVKVAFLKSRSPSCGVNRIYDGSFSNKIIVGDGSTTKLFKEEGIFVFTENDILKDGFKEELASYLDI